MRIRKVVGESEMGCNVNEAIMDATLHCIKQGCGVEIEHCDLFYEIKLDDALDFTSMIKKRRQVKENDAK